MQNSTEFQLFIPNRLMEVLESMPEDLFEGDVVALALLMLKRLDHLSELAGLDSVAQ